MKTSHCRYSPRRLSAGLPGFTLVELLVVIAIIGVLVALLLPAVQAAREAARRMKCSNNLKQMGLAIQSYHDVHLAFPPGHIVQKADPEYSPTADNKIESWGWGAFLLPFLEQQALYDQAGISSGQILQRVVNPIALTPLSVYRCASDPAPKIGEGRLQDANWAISNYKACHGHGFGALEITPNLAVMNGVFSKAGGNVTDTVRMKDVTDGLSNTIMVGETVWKRGGLLVRAGVWVGTVRGIGGSSSHDIYAGGRGPLNFSIANTNVLGGTFHSLHSGGGVQFVLGDGSVRFISENIQFNTTGSTAAVPNNNSDVDSTYERLLSRNDGQPLGDF